MIRVAAAALVIHEGKILLLKRDDYDKVSPGLWSFPGGKVEEGETLEDALIRELKEEANIEGAILDIIYATTIFTGEDQLHLLHYLVKPTSFNVKISDEHSAFKWVNLKAVKDHLPSVIIKDFEYYNVLEKLIKTINK